MIIRHETAMCDCISLLHEIREIGPLRVGFLRWFCSQKESLLMLEIPFWILNLINSRCLLRIFRVSYQVRERGGGILLVWKSIEQAVRWRARDRR